VVCAARAENVLANVLTPDGKDAQEAILFLAAGNGLGIRLGSAQIELPVP
jgi:hypothetical protein